MEAKLLLIQALSPLHAGTGQGVGVIDQPIAREKATDIPFLPGTTIKGVFRDACPEADRNNIFGPDTGSAELYSGAATFTDARLLLLPVRSLRGVFAWVTSPLLISRLMRDAQRITDVSKLSQKPDVDDNTCLISQKDSANKADKDSALLMSFNNKDTVVLEDLELTAQSSNDVNELADWLKTNFALDAKERLCIISDDNLAFLLETATEITARIAIEKDKKTVKDGALWYEEALPVETVLVSMVVAINNTRIQPATVFTKVKSLTDKSLQFGGNATVGRGLCKAALIG